MKKIRNNYPMGDIHPTEITRKTPLQESRKGVFCIIKYAYQLRELVQSRSALHGFQLATDISLMVQHPNCQYHPHPSLQHLK